MKCSVMIRSIKNSGSTYLYLVDNENACFQILCQRISQYSQHLVTTDSNKYIINNQIKCRFPVFAGRKLVRRFCYFASCMIQKQVDLYILFKQNPLVSRRGFKFCQLQWIAKILKFFDKQFSISINAVPSGTPCMFHKYSTRL